MHLFLALKAQRTSEPVSDDLEDQELLLQFREELEQALEAGEFKVLAWAAAAVLGLRYLERKRKSHPQISPAPKKESRGRQLPGFDCPDQERVS